MHWFKSIWPKILFELRDNSDYADSDYAEFTALQLTWYWVASKSKSLNFSRCSSLTLMTSSVPSSFIATIWPSLLLNSITCNRTRNSDTKLCYEWSVYRLILSCECSSHVTTCFRTFVRTFESMLCRGSNMKVIGRYPDQYFYDCLSIVSVLGIEIFIGAQPK